MATVLSSPRMESAANQRRDNLARRRQAVEELTRNGVTISPEWAKLVDDREQDLPALNIRDINKEDYQSNADARSMAGVDIRNVEFLSTLEECQLLKVVYKMLGRLECQSTFTEWESGQPDWPDDDVRWTLTPHQLRKLSRR